MCTLEQKNSECDHCDVKHVWLARCVQAFGEWVASSRAVVVIYDVSLPVLNKKEMWRRKAREGWKVLVQLLAWISRCVVFDESFIFPLQIQLSPEQHTLKDLSVNF